MRSWMRSTLILAMVLGTPGIHAWAGDTPSATLQPSPSGTTAQASQQVAPSSAASPSDENGGVDDEEAPADSQSAEATPPDDAQETNGGLKTTTDKIVDKFMLLDSDASKGVSMDEYMTMVQMRAKARFAAMDANGDGQVTADEYRAFWKARMAQWYRLKH